MIQRKNIIKNILREGLNLQKKKIQDPEKTHFKNKNINMPYLAFDLETTEKYENQIVHTGEISFGDMTFFGHIYCDEYGKYMSADFETVDGNTDILQPINLTVVAEGLEHELDKFFEDVADRIRFDLQEGLNLQKKKIQEPATVEELKQFLPHLSIKFTDDDFVFDVEESSYILMSHETTIFDVKIYVYEDYFMAQAFSAEDELAGEETFDKTPKGINQFKAWVGIIFNERYDLAEGLNLKKKNPDLLAQIMAYEDGKLDGQGIIKLFAELIKTGQVWQFQGSYGRQAAELIKMGYIDHSGNILKSRI